FAQIAVINLMLAGFNLLPAFPMDGGRVLRALLATRYDRVDATRIAAAAGQAVAFAMGLFGVSTGNPILVLIAAFIFFASQAENSQEALLGLARNEHARDAMITEFEALRPDDSLELAATTLIRTTQHEFPVIDPASGRPLGLLTRAALYRALDGGHRAAPVAEAMTTGIPTVRLQDGLGHVLEALGNGAPAVFVTDRTGALLGYITRENLGEWLVVTNARRGGRAPGISG
ncbi:MAG: CBS domain-containing protein, partial [Alphaproteobacteria bacterium]